MTIQNQLKLLPLSDIEYSRASRQRTDLTSASVYDLANNISQYGLLQNIGVTADSHEIVFGERRLTAFKLLNKAACRPLGELLDIGLTEPQAARIQQLAKSNLLYDSWSKIPVRLIKGVDKIGQSSLEFIENVSREDLPWQDKAQAAYKIHKAAIAANKQRNATRPEGQPPERWTDSQSAALLGISRNYFNELIAALREAESASPKTKPKITAAIKDSATAKSALNASRIIKERYGEQSTTSADPIKRMAGRLGKPKPKPEPEPEPDDDSSCPIICADFHEWAASFAGTPFNFIHCDFPYGIDYNAGAGNYTSTATKAVGAYDDSEKILWALLDSLISPAIIAKESHILFWFSQNHRRKLEDRLAQLLPKINSDFEIHSHLLIWHVSDNFGLLPRPKHEGRRTYETALQITLGSRPLTTTRALSFAYPKRGDRIHRSQKPLPVLNHFLPMFIDESSSVLDPTCGSGTSIIAAQKAGAKRALGLEIDEEMYKLATDHYHKQAKQP